MRPREFLPRDFFGLPPDGDDEAIVGRGPNILLRDRARLLARRRLNQAVGEGQPNEPDDVAQVETFVRATGNLDFGVRHEPTGLFSAPLRDAIRDFQSRNRLLDDGIVTPDGETLRALQRELASDTQDRSPDGIVDPADPECARLASRVRSARLTLANWLTVQAEDEARVQEAETRLERARAAMAAASAGAAVRGPQGVVGLFGAGIGLSAAASELATAENGLALERGRLENTVRNVRRAEAELRSLQTAFDVQCG